MSSGKLQSEVLPKYDIILVDLAVNSAGFPSGGYQARLMDEFLWTLLNPANQRKRVVMVLETYRTCLNWLDDCRKHCAEDHGGTMDLSFADGSNSLGKYGWCDKWYHLQDNEMAVLQHYGVPVASYRDAAFPDRGHPPDTLPCYWNGLAHPDGMAHTMMATVMAHTFYRTMTQWCGKDSTCQDDSALSMYNAADTDDFCAARIGVQRTTLKPGSPALWPAVEVTGDWSLAEDVKGKPGWLVNTGNNSINGSMHTVTFNVTFTNHSQLEVTYLKTYEKIGAARVYIGNASLTASSRHEAIAVYTLSALRAQHYSVPHTAIINARTEQAANGTQESERGFVVEKSGFERIAASPGEYRVLFELIPVPYGKFKLLEIMSC